MKRRITTPFNEEQALSLRAGDNVLICGVIYTARDAAHKRLDELMDAGLELPVDLNDQIIFYVGPTPAKPGEVSGSAGPTTATRMDLYTPRLIECQGLRGMIGKGERSQEVIATQIKHKAVYFAAIGGAGALLAESVKESATAAYEDLGAEAIYRLVVQDFPCTVVIDCYGNNLYRLGPDEYLNWLRTQN
jgi:fumarate hydratase subunit beta